ncbi:MAG: hypothetical protein J3K34DRAFT_420609 [Monoraphidium minutum]|nr:MAG: hypothetical protein J3K34DRAFT_420609 [Monoraphidium minutum]
MALRSRGRPQGKPSGVAAASAPDQHISRPGATSSKDQAIASAPPPRQPAANARVRPQRAGRAAPRVAARRRGCRLLSSTAAMPPLPPPRRARSVVAVAVAQLAVDAAVGRVHRGALVHDLAVAGGAAKQLGVVAGVRRVLDGRRDPLLEADLARARQRRILVGAQVQPARQEQPVLGRQLERRLQERGVHGCCRCCCCRCCGCARARRSPPAPHSARLCRAAARAALARWTKPESASRAYEQRLIDFRELTDMSACGGGEKA